MNAAQLFLDVTLIGLLAATLLYAMRLQRSIGVLRQDRPVFERLVADLNSSTREARAGIECLRATAEDAGRLAERHARDGSDLKEDLRLLVERGEQVADRLDRLLRAGRDTGAAAPRVPAQLGFDTDFARLDAPSAHPRVRSQAERDLLAALRTSH